MAFVFEGLCRMRAGQSELRKAHIESKSNRQHGGNNHQARNAFDLCWHSCQWARSVKALYTKAITINL